MTTLALSITLFAGCMTLYYLVLFALAEATHRRARRGSDHRATCAAPVFVIVIPARNERVVIERTVQLAAQLEFDELVVLVMDDGSDDGTADVVRAAVGHDGRVLVVERSAAIAGRGKGDVLNHAFRLVCGMVERADPALRGAQADEVVFGILDADGWLEPHALTAVAPCFDDPQVAGVQLPVRMWNARAGYLARMQDIEFVAYGFLFQAGRERLGSVMMGGNGQFIRLSALQTLGDTPWTDNLTEDLDIGLRLVENGWRHRFCSNAYVSQQALPEFARFVRQRTRWVQGHLSCWSHLPALWNPLRRIPLRARIDLSLHLLLGAFGIIAAAQVLMAAAAAAGTIEVHALLSADTYELPDLLLPTLLVLFTFSPALLVGIVYQRFASARLPLRAAPGVIFVYCFYHYVWGVPATVRAVARLVANRDSWAKTSRTLVSEHDLAAEAAAHEGIPC